VRALLDTCALFELQRPRADLRVRARVEKLDPDALFLSVITLGELTKGVASLPESRRRTELRSWLMGLEQRFADRILGIDADVTHLWGELTARTQAQGVRVPVGDGLIAATALRRGLTVVTRNTRHVAASGAVILDPWNE